MPAPSLALIGSKQWLIEIGWTDWWKSYATGIQHPIEDRAWFEDLQARLKSLGCGPAWMQSHHPCCWGIWCQQNTPTANKHKLTLHPFCECWQWHSFSLSNTYKHPSSHLQFDSQLNTYCIDLSKPALLCSPPPFTFGIHQISIIKNSVKLMIANEVLCLVKVYSPFDITSRGVTACGEWHLNQRCTSRESRACALYRTFSSDDAGC